MSHDRKTWDDTWLAVAAALGGRSRCVRSQVGCVIVSDDQRVVSCSYNGPPAGVLLVDNENCAAFCPRGSISADQRAATYDNCVAVHAEANALMRASFNDMRGGTLYVTRAPCLDCAKLVANAGLRRVVWLSDNDYDHLRSVDSIVEYLTNASIEIYIISSGHFQVRQSTAKKDG